MQAIEPNAKLSGMVNKIIAKRQVKSNSLLTKEVICESDLLIFFLF
jgi:hypothetical protein